MSNPRSTKHFYRQLDENKNQIRHQSFHMLCGILYWMGCQLSSASFVHFLFAFIVNKWSN